MINATKEMREARHGLQTLSASDPLAQANILRHVAAFTKLLTGRPGIDASPSEPLVGAGFRLVDGEERLLAALPRRDGIERIYIAFDIDDAQGPPIGTGLFRKEGDHVACYGLCKLWSPLGDGRALLVPTKGGEHAGYFAFRRGQPFRRVEGPLPGDFIAGLRRTQARMDRLLKTAEADPAPKRGFATVVSNVGQEIFTRPLRLAA
ncbi:hypothetical protein [Sphingomonas faeni]|uniref:hypothetical protein n=1 Tax=Sphingomonas faeni TaxID=185950 RepID=UPI0033553FB8